MDTSALMAIVLNDTNADACIVALETEESLLISAGTVAEALIVSARRNAGAEMAGLIDGLGFEVINVTSASAWRIAQAYEDWGKGVHPAALNFGDCFAFEVAKEHGCALLIPVTIFQEPTSRAFFDVLAATCSCRSELGRREM